METNRLASIDIFRAMTMMLMIVVIDLESITNIPIWVGHAGISEDRMGLADIVFPCFLFMVGLCIPHAVNSRRANGSGFREVAIHIGSRALSLITMGLYVVNLDHMNDKSMVIHKSYWQILMVIGFVLIWNDYRSTLVFKIFPKWTMWVFGWLILGFLAYTYKGPSDEWMKVYWWGILGLLGWAYGVCALLFLLIGQRLIWLGGATLLMLALNINEFIGGFDLRLVISGSNYFMVLLGVLTSAIIVKYVGRENLKAGVSVLLFLAVCLLFFGVATRPEWGISKIKATPSWATISSGFALLFFLLLVYIADMRKHVFWARPISAGGYATLTCYFALYFIYSVMHIMNLHWPDFVSNGVLGVARTIGFSLFVIQFTAWAVKFNVKLKV